MYWSNQTGLLETREICTLFAMYETVDVDAFEMYSLNAYTTHPFLLRQEYETDKSSMLAFSMGQQDRLGAGSSVRSLDPEILRIIDDIYTSRNRTR